MTRLGPKLLDPLLFFMDNKRVVCASRADRSRDHAHAEECMSLWRQPTQGTGVEDEGNLEEIWHVRYPRILRRRARLSRSVRMPSTKRFRCSRRLSSPSSTRPST